MTEAIFDFAAIARINRRESAVSKVEEQPVAAPVRQGLSGPDILKEYYAKKSRLAQQYYNDMKALGSCNMHASMGQQAGNVGQPENT